MRGPATVVAALALVFAACGGDSDAPPPAADAGGARSAAPGATPPGPVGSTLDLGAENIAFSTSSLQADAGKVAIRFANNDDGVPHNLHVTGNGVDQKTAVQPGPVTQRLALDLDSGTYAFVCDVHPQQMTGQLTVR